MFSDFKVKTNNWVVFVLGWVDNKIPPRDKREISRIRYINNDTTNPSNKYQKQSNKLIQLYTHTY